MLKILRLIMFFLASVKCFQFVMCKYGEKDDVQNIYIHEILLYDV